MKIRIAFSFLLIAGFAVGARAERAQAPLELPRLQAALSAPVQAHGQVSAGFQAVQAARGIGGDVAELERFSEGQAYEHMSAGYDHQAVRAQGAESPVDARGTNISARGTLSKSAGRRTGWRAAATAAVVLAPFLANAQMMADSHSDNIEYLLLMILLLLISRAGSRN